ALTKLKTPQAAPVLLERLKADDPVVRAAAANGIGELKPANGAAALASAYDAGQRDTIYVARAAALAALAKYGNAAAAPTLRAARADRDWGVRGRAVMLLEELDPSLAPGTAEAAALAAQIRPAPTTIAADVYAAPRLTSPSVSPMLYIDTDRGTIQVELAVLD